MSRPCVLCAILLFTALAPHAASGFGFEDIAFWVGSGEHRAGVAIDWDGDDTGTAGLPTLAWGYRWDGTQTAEQALRAILAADGRLYAKLDSTGALGVATYGFGYDANHNGAFALDDGSPFDADGIAESTSSDGALSVDPQDVYREGWLFSFWHVALSAGPDASDWATAGVGFSSITLTPDGWISLAHTPTFNFSAFANEIAAAPSPGLPGDYNGDNRVDAADYTVWRDTLADPTSYALWRTNYGAVAPSAAAPKILTTPEPAAVGLLLVCLAALSARPADRQGRLC